MKFLKGRFLIEVGLDENRLFLATSGADGRVKFIVRSQVKM